MMNNITKKKLETDSETGLDKNIEVYAINIDANNEQVIIYYRICLVSPTGKVMKVLEDSTFRRYNKAAVLDENNQEISPANPKWNMLKASPIGQGIVQMLNADIDIYPDLEQS